MRLGKIKNFFVIFLVFTLIVSLLVFFNITAKKTILKACNSEISARINDIINTSNEHLMSMDVFYSDFFSVNFDDEKKVSAVIANTGLINQIVLLNMKQMELNL